MKNFIDFITEAQSKKLVPITLVSTRNSECAFLFGSMDYPLDPQQVHKLCKKMNIAWVPVDHDFDDMEEGDFKAGAIYEPGEERIVWYDIMDGTVDELDIRDISKA